MNKITKNILSVTVLTFCMAAIASAQITQQKIGTNPTKITPSAVLDVESTNKGVLMPRISLKGTNDLLTILAPADALTVYNMATEGTAPNDVTPGYYYFSIAENKWIKLATIKDGIEPWNLEKTLIKATLNNQNIYQNGNVGIGDFAVTNPITKLDVRGAMRSGSPHIDELNGTSVIGDYSAAFGQDNLARGDWSFAAAGLRNYSLGDASVTMGQDNKASGGISIAIGNGNHAEEEWSVAIGTSNTTKGAYSTAFGTGLNVSTYGSTVVGSRNAIITGNPDNYEVTDAVFQVGSGYGNEGSPNSRRSSITVLYNGNTAIGLSGQGNNAKPTERLDIGEGDSDGDNKGSIRIRAINNSAYTGSIATDKIVVADATGVLKTVTVASIGTQGPKGDTGAAGAQGIQGLDGTPGTNGADGAPGVSVPQTITHTLNSAGNTLTSDVNGIKPTANIINTNTLTVVGKNLTSTVNGVASTGLDLTDIVKAVTSHTMSSSVNTITSIVNGVTAVAPAVNTVSNTLAPDNKLTITVNGVDSAPVDLTSLKTTITANNGLTLATNNVKLGGILAEKTIVTTDGTNTLAIAGLQSGTIEDNVVVSSTGGVLKTVGTSTLAIEPWNIQGTTATKATSNTDKIYQMGTVAIGATVIPAAEVTANNPTLYVAGGISTTGKVYTTNSVYADYVFEKYFKGTSAINPNYEFKSLNYVKKFIQANHHLPGVASIDELKKAENGYTFDMTKLTIQSLEKIEELYLHTIEQKDKIDQQQAEIDNLKKASKDVTLRLERLEKLLVTGDK